MSQSCPPTTTAGPVDAGLPAPGQKPDFCSPAKAPTAFPPTARPRFAAVPLEVGRWQPGSISTRRQDPAPTVEQKPTRDQHYGPIQTSGQTRGAVGRHLRSQKDSRARNCKKQGRQICLRTRANIYRRVSTNKETGGRPVAKAPDVSKSAGQSCPENGQTHPTDGGGG